MNDDSSSLAKRLSRARIAVIGDFALDAYWDIDPDDRELSLETGKPTHSVVAQRYPLGGAGNCVRHAAALGASAIPVGVVGTDLFGSEMLRCFRTIGIDVSHVLVCDRWSTPVYAKPLLQGHEQERYDFGRRNVPSPEVERTLLASLRALFQRVDGVIVNQQLLTGLMSANLIQQLNSIAAQHTEKTFVLNSRDMTHRFRDMHGWLNVTEAARICSHSALANTQEVSTEQVLDWARQLYAMLGRPLVITRGQKGLAGFDGAPHHVPGITIAGPTDATGAGDAGVTVFTLALCAGFGFQQAMQLANRAAAATVRSVNDTGTVRASDFLLPDRPELE